MSFSWATVLYILIGFLGLNILVAFHELGHFIAARACGIRVQSVSFGFGPAFFVFKRRETEFRICVIPFGGATTMAGRDDLRRAIQKGETRIENCEEGSIYAVSPVKRIITYLAGPVANILFAAICFVILLVIPVLSVTLKPVIRLTSDTAEYASSYCAAEQAGLMTGDTVTAVDSTPVTTWQELQDILTLHSQDPVVEITTDRGTFYVEPHDGLFGLLPDNRFEETQTPGRPLWESTGIAFRECFSQIGVFLDAITGLFLGKNRLSETLGGAISASEHIGMITERSFGISFNTGIRVVLYLLASVSISLGIANLLPITALDGGLILISIAELVAGHSLHPKSYVVLQVTGVLIVMVVIPVLRLFL